jgi:hypothetical protein
MNTAMNGGWLANLSANPTASRVHFGFWQTDLDGTIKESVVG